MGDITAILALAVIFCRFTLNFPAVHSVKANCNLESHFEKNGTCTRRSEVNQPCEDPGQCALNQGLRCNNTTEKGECLEKSQETDDCVGLAGQPCVNGECTANGHCQNVPGPAQMSRGENRGKNASLLPKCVCNESYYHSEPDGKCLRQAYVHESCTKSVQCLAYNGVKLSCINGVCDCDPRKSVFGDARQTKYPKWAKESKPNGFSEYHGTQCLGLAGQPCINEVCEPNAYCEKADWPGFYREGLWVKTGTCSCQDRFHKSRSGLCKVGLDRTPGEEPRCSSSEECVEGLICKQGNCFCPFPEIQEFNKYDSDAVCVSRIGGPCSRQEGCVNSSECKIVGQGESGHCTCKRGFVENKEGNCDIAHGQDCSKFRNCDTVAGLKCVDKVCKCSGFEKFNVELRLCEGLVGAFCHVEESNSNNSAVKCPKPEFSPVSFEAQVKVRLKKCGQNMNCVSRFPGHCVLPSDPKGGRCACQPGFVESGNYTCERAPEVASGLENSTTAQDKTVISGGQERFAVTEY